jgi:hypothetical protein
MFDGRFLSRGEGVGCFHFFTNKHVSILTIRTAFFLRNPFIDSIFSKQTCTFAKSRILPKLGFLCKGSVMTHVDPPENLVFSPFFSIMNRMII